jgi:hypothetical protein
MKDGKPSRLKARSGGVAEVDPGEGGAARFESGWRSGIPPCGETHFSKCYFSERSWAESPLARGALVDDPLVYGQRALSSSYEATGCVQVAQDFSLCHTC